MSKNVKILVVTGVFMNLDESDELSWILGYYTNLKELYKNLSMEISNHILQYALHIKRKDIMYQRTQDFGIIKTIENLMKFLLEI